MTPSPAAAAIPPSDATSSDRCAAFADEVARVCSERGSWRRRLEWVRDLVRDGRASDAAVLGYLGVFLKLVATGSIPSREDGGHFRPSHHAELGLDIERMLLSRTPRNGRSLVRGILRYLPSHDLPFRRAEPLTRIRDIAHRNDIPHDLKDEIKHTLQNKLHRSAGPEDLKTSEALLVRFTTPGAPYPEAFVTEFRRFHEELRAFFNAGSVEGDLESLLPDLPADAIAPAKELLAVMVLPLDSAERIDHELALITRLRQALEIAFGDPDAPTAQKMRLADLKLDERAFLLLAERTNRLEAGKDAPEVQRMLAVLGEAAAQLVLSGIDADHLSILAEAARLPEDGDVLRRARARFETARTVLGRYADRVLHDCARFAEELGQRLHMPEYIAEQFAAREIRGSLAFQVSRLVDHGLAETATALQLPVWQAVVPGTAQGHLARVEGLAPLATVAQPTLAVVDHLDGDEEIPRQVRALLVGHDIPHLSHVAIRARQAGVPTAARRDAGRLEDLLATQIGRTVSLKIGEQGVSVHPVDSVEADAIAPGSQTGPTSPVTEPALWSLDQAEVQTSGAKAWGARRLASISAEGNLRSPAGFVVPFGVFEACLARDPQRQVECRSLLELLDDPARRDSSAQASTRLQQLIEAMPLPEPFLGQLVERSTSLGHVAVRSSSNAEDRQGAVGAGLFDSVIGVQPDGIGTALRRVWGSLYGRRALAAVHASGGRASDLHMAILVQPVIPAELSFVMYTRSPFATDEDLAYVELAAGLGETLASASGEGSPYRMHLERVRRAHRLSTYLSYPDGIFLGRDGRRELRPVGFHELRFDRDPTWRQQMAERLIDAARLLERELGGPQDVEGAIVGDELWLLQSRPAASSAGVAA